MNYTSIQKKVNAFKISNLVIVFLLSFAYNINAQDANLMWVKSIGGTQADVAHDIGLDDMGNIYTVGAYRGTVDFDPGAGTYSLTSGSTSDIFVTKMDPNGNFIWARSIGGTSTFNTPWSMVVDSVGNVYVTGHYTGTTDFDPGVATYSITSSGYDIFIFKLNPSGSFVWAKTFGNAADESGQAISFDNTGNLVFTGYYYNTVDFDPGAGVSNLVASGSSDVFVTKMDTAGNLIWAKTFGGTATDVANAITVDTGGNIYTTGGFYGTADFNPSVGTYTMTSSGNDDAYINKLDAAGNFLWAVSFNGADDYGKGTSIVTDPSGNVYSSGFFKGVVDFDSGAGTNTLSTSSSADPDSYIIKLDGTGNLIWVKKLGGSAGADYVYSIDLDQSGNVYSTGFSNGTADYDPGPAVYNLEPHIFVSKLSTAGNFMWAKSFEGPGLDQGAAIYVDDLANVFVAGYFYNTVDFDPRAGVYNVTSAGIADAFILKLCQMADPVITPDGPLNFCSGSSVTLSSSMFPNYTWSTGATTQSISVNSTGDYSVAVTNALGCTAISPAVSVTVNTIPVMPSAISGATSVCEGTPVSYSVPAISNAPSYTWSLPSGWVGTSPTNTISTVAMPSSGPLMVSATNTCGTSPTQTLNVTGHALPAVSYNESTNMVCVTVTSMTLDAASPFGGTYTGTAVTGNTFNPNAAGSGTFDIVYTYTDGNSCTSSDTSSIIVDQCTGINSLVNNTTLTLYPNPSSGNLIVKSTTEGNYILENELGQAIHKFSLNALNNYSVSIDNLSSGLYIIVGSTENQSVRKKIIVTK